MYLHLERDSFHHAETDFNGEYPVTLDSKSRILFPAALKKQNPLRKRRIVFMMLRATDKWPRDVCDSRLGNSQ
jgi:hypothetical protein